MLFQVLVPPGFMLGASAAKTLPFALEICTADGLVAIPAGAPAPDDRAPGHDAPDTAGEIPCAFAAQPAAWPPPPLRTLARMDVTMAATPSPGGRSAVRPGRGVSGPPLPARGPPPLLT